MSLSSHPHDAPRQPAAGARPNVNPPVFLWRPEAEAPPFRLQVATDSQFDKVVLDIPGLRDSLYLPERAFAPGHYYWRWRTATATSEAFAFEIRPETTVVETPALAEWFRKMPERHPRYAIRPETLAMLRASREAGRAGFWMTLKAQADALLPLPHHMDEPPFLPEDWHARRRAFIDIMWQSRRFMKGMETLALAYLASGDKSYAHAARERLLSAAQWNPDGASCLSHNDEAHMAVVWYGPSACDWIWDCLREDEKASIIGQFRRRGEIIFEWMHDRGAYGVTRFGSHDGREIVFLANMAMTFHEQLPDAQRWLEWLRPVLCGVWPIWAEDDGAWAEGPSYGLAYVRIMARFALPLKIATGIDLFKKPFWRNHAVWRQWCLPPYAEWIGFGDHTERMANTWRANGDLVEMIAAQTHSPDLRPYATAFQEAAETCPEREATLPTAMWPMRYLAEPSPSDAQETEPARQALQVFPRRRLGRHTRKSRPPERGYRLHLSILALWIGQSFDTPTTTISSFTPAAKSC